MEDFESRTKTFEVLFIFTVICKTTPATFYQYHPHCHSELSYPSRTGWDGMQARAVEPYFEAVFQCGCC